MMTLSETNDATDRSLVSPNIEQSSTFARFQGHYAVIRITAARFVRLRIDMDHLYIRAEEEKP